MTRSRSLLAAVALASLAAAAPGLPGPGERSSAGANSAPAPVKEREKGPLDAFRFVAFDGFDGKLGLNWQPVRPDPSHVSLKAHPGRLTIVTQKGTIHGSAEKGEGKVAAKNIFVIDNPLAKEADFVATTCVVDFKPTDNYHQAGLILYDDDDNYLKFTFEFHPTAGVYAVVVNEQAGEPKHHPVELDREVARLWLRFTKKGTTYEYATSIDGERFVAHGTTEWGTAAPKKLGLIAKNGGAGDVPEIEAQFEFFELKAP